MFVAYSHQKHRFTSLVRTINFEHQVDQRSVNRRSNLISLAMEKQDLKI